jgi:hypothetical protein
MLRALLKVGAIVFVGVVILVWIGDSVEREAAESRQKQTIAPQPKSLIRRMDVKTAQDQLLRMGFDVQVTFINEDDSKMIVYGKSVNRPFAYNLMARKDFRKMLRDGKFSEVTFMDSMKFPDFVQIFPVGSP